MSNSLNSIAKVLSAAALGTALLTACEKQSVNPSNPIANALANALKNGDSTGVRPPQDTTRGGRPFPDTTWTPPHDSIPGDTTGHGHPHPYPHDSLGWPVPPDTLWGRPPYHDSTGVDTTHHRRRH